MDIDDRIDQCLKKLSTAHEHTMFADELYGDDFMYNVPHAIDRALIGRGLIEQHNEARILTELGIRISQLGGWKQYLIKQDQSAKRESESQAEIQALTKRQLELSIRKMQVNFTQIKHWWLILLITSIVSAGLSALVQLIFGISSSFVRNQTSSPSS